MRALTALAPSAPRWRGIGDALAAPWTGVVDSRSYLAFRVGIASLVLIRTTDWLRPVLTFDHYAWVEGIDDAPWVDAVSEPALRSPLIDGLAFGDALTAVLVVLRTALAVALLFGVRPRWTAGALALVGFVVMAGDRYRYLHHMQLLWTSCAWLALAPTPVSSALRWVPRWPLSLLRLQALIVYGAAGLAKLEPGWLDGSALELAERGRLMSGAVWDFAIRMLGYSGVATSVAVWELALVPLLAWRRTRLVGVAVALALHVTIDLVATVSIFGATMVLYAAMFLPWRGDERS